MPPSKALLSGAPAGLAAPGNAPGIGGGGGAPPEGIGGGGGALPVGKGGGGGALPVGRGGGGGALENGAGGGLPALLTGLEVVGVPLLSMEERGRGGAIVPKSREASCFAPPPGRLSSSSSDVSASVSAPEPQSSESARARAARVAAVAGSTGCWGRRWNGFVETSEPLGVEVEAEVAAAAGLAACAIFFKNGLFVPSAAGGLVTVLRG